MAEAGLELEHQVGALSVPERTRVREYVQTSVVVVLPVDADNCGCSLGLKPTSHDEPTTAQPATHESMLSLKSDNKVAPANGVIASADMTSHTVYSTPAGKQTVAASLTKNSADATSDA